MVHTIRTTVLSIWWYGTIARETSAANKGSAIAVCDVTSKTDTRRKTRPLEWKKKIDVADATSQSGGNHKPIVLANRRHHRGTSHSLQHGTSPMTVSTSE